MTATLMHATARWTVDYGRDLHFAGRDLPRPRRVRVPTRHGTVRIHVHHDPRWPAGPRPVHVHFHGGAWLMRYPQMDDFWCRYLVAEAGVVVVNVDFHAGPYVTYPVAQEECHDVVAWLAEHGERVGVDGGRISVGGFSSGGGLAASVCLQGRDHGTVRPRLQVLGVPALDLASDLPAGAPGMISPQLRGLVRRVYFPDPRTRGEPYASPVLAPDLTGLPPAVVCTAERDALRRDGEAYARRLREAGIAVVEDVTPAADHYFLTEDLGRARSTMAMMAGAIASHLS
ncbi:alpha/beta hydrolase [Nocardioides panacisoli]|uniref:alpha/beta hydrolase n=1 Tax=Nocardioides panacisoli TaxID=627624 RepID=UPI001C637F09|nr:alpha/beta hydrolase [Nocardioides panacisoli]QYJ05723.1 alpha/beta hydrolase [Nocardioides panacisoli]